MYTDGAATGNPGPGGFGVVLMSGPHRKEIAGGFRLTTNNRMELLAVIVGLEALNQKDNNVIIYSDSRYVVDSVEKRWVDGWVKKGFAGKKNPDLWIRYLKAANGQNIKFVWVKGHANIKENERCDVLATTAAGSKNLGVDEYYEKNAN